MTHPTSSPTPAAPSAMFPETAARAVVEPALVDGVDVDAVTRAVRACAGVAGLHSGRFGEIGSYLPGRRFGGVQVDDEAVTVHVRARWGHSVRDLFVQVEGVTVALRNGSRLDLVVDDIEDDLTGTTDAAAALNVVASPRAIEPAALGAGAKAPTTNLPLPESSSS